MEDFSSTGQVITHGLADGTIRSNTELFSFEEFNSLIVKLILGLGVLSHCSSRPESESYDCSKLYMLGYAYEAK